MTATTHTFDAATTEMEFNTEDFMRGGKIVFATLGLLAGVSAACLAMACSTVWISVLVWFISAVVLTILAFLVGVYTSVMHADKVEAVGYVAGKAINKFKGLFGR